MDYEKKYKKALERAATELETCGADESLRNMIYAIFPDELKESEDEQTRKGLINFLKSPFIRENIADWKVTPWIAWVEKQSKNDTDNFKGSQREQIAKFTEALYIAPCAGTINGQGITNQVSQSEVTKTSEQVWNEGDEEELGIAIQYLQLEGQYDSINWLKSLKDRLKGE